MNDGMSHQEFQNYLGLLSSLLRLGTSQREGIEEELRGHLEERLAALTARGIEPERAISMALGEFGDAAALAAEFSAISKLRKRRWMMRFGTVLFAAVLLFAAVIGLTLPGGFEELASEAAYAQEAEKPAPTKTDELDANAKARARLESTINVEFVDVPLNGFLEYLADTAGFQFYVDNRGLDESGVDPNAVTVTMSLEGVPVEMVLRLALRQHGLAYTLDHGVVIVTSCEEVESNLDIRVYCVEDLLETENAEDIETLAHLIQSTVAPGSWRSSSDNGPTIRPYGGMLVVSQTFMVHGNIRKLLQGLRGKTTK